MLSLHALTDQGKPMGIYVEKVASGRGSSPEFDSVLALPAEPSENKCLAHSMACVRAVLAD